MGYVRQYGCVEGDGLLGGRSHCVRSEERRVLGELKCVCCVPLPAHRRMQRKSTEQIGGSCETGAQLTCAYRFRCCGCDSTQPQAAYLSFGDARMFLQHGNRNDLLFFGCGQRHEAMHNDTTNDETN